MNQSPLTMHVGPHIILEQKIAQNISDEIKNYYLKYRLRNDFKNKIIIILK